MEELYAYRASLLAALEETIHELADKVSSLPPEKWNQQIISVGHTPHYLLFHLRELEQQVFTAQMTRILAEDIPTIPAFDVESWMGKYYRPGEASSTIVECLSELRHQELTWLHNLPHFGWSCLARHSWWGLHTLQWWVELQVDYSYTHLKQLSSIADM